MGVYRVFAWDRGSDRFLCRGKKAVEREALEDGKSLSVTAGQSYVSREGYGNIGFFVAGVRFGDRREQEGGQRG